MKPRNRTRIIGLATLKEVRRAELPYGLARAKDQPGNAAAERSNAHMKKLSKVLRARRARPWTTRVYTEAPGTGTNSVVMTWSKKW